MSNVERGNRQGDPLRIKTKSLAVHVLRLVDALNARDVATQVIVRQLVRSATSVGANYRAATRARSSKEMYAKLAIVEEEADEVMYWIELMQESRKANSDTLRQINNLAHEVVAMVVASKKTLSGRMAQEPGTKSRRRGRSTFDARHSPFPDSESGSLQ